MNKKFSEESRKSSDPVVELIYQSVRLLSDYTELFRENKRLKARIKALERILWGTEGFK